MRTKVITKFQDKNTKALHEVGDTIEITDKRFEEINSASYRVFVEAIEEENINFDNMTKKEIVKFAEEKGIDLNMRMTKKEMVEELS